MISTNIARRFALVLALFPITACQVSDELVQDASRGAAKTVVNGVISQRFPGVDAAPYTDCIIENATTNEIVSLAKDAVAGADDATVSTVLEIAGRPETSDCLTRNALGVILG